MTSYSKFLFAITFFVLTSCQVQTEFNAEKWKQEVDGTYPNRFQMIKDILSKNLLKEKNELEMETLLGKSYSVDSSNQDRKEFSYQVQIAYGWDIDPRFYSNLVLTMNNETGKIIKVEFIESEDRRSWLEKLTTSKY